MGGASLGRWYRQPISIFHILRVSHRILSNCLGVDGIHIAHLHLMGVPDRPTPPRLVAGLNANNC